MMTSASTKIKPKGGAPRRFKYVCLAAAEFGFHRTYLSRVLKGQFPDHHGLTARYQAFVAKQGAK